MDWRDVDWKALERLRGNFLKDERVASQYWASDADLESYDFTFAERIGWKWDAVLDELKTRGWSPSGTSILDWGCGSGIASRRLIEAFPGRFKSLRVWDHSPRARDFAVARARAAFPELHVEASSEPAEILVVSHVLNELGSQDQRTLVNRMAQHSEILSVEPGTRTVSRQLSKIRNDLLATGAYAVVAPCTHSRACGMLDPQNEPHWCHAFARPPAWVHHDSDWADFGRKMGIDLRRVPYSFLVAVKKAPEAPQQEARLIGDARVYKGFAKLLECHGDRGVAERILQKRDGPRLFKKIQQPVVAPVFKWQVNENKIQSEEKSQEELEEAGEEQ